MTRLDEIVPEMIFCALRSESPPAGSVLQTFPKHYENTEYISVFWKQNWSNRAAYKLNELLHDITVAETVLTESAVRTMQIPIISRPVWQVESEMSRDSRAALLDFSKLVLGSAEHKLFIGPFVSNRARFRDALLPAAVRCSGDVYAAFIPHSAAWKRIDPIVELWRLSAGQWICEH